MPSPKSGNPCTLVSPAAPRAAVEADLADPGQVDAARAAASRSGTGKSGTATVKPFKPGGGGDDGGGGSGADGGDAAAAAKTGWIEVQMVDEAGKPVPSLAYSVTLPDGSVAEGTLDENGLARVEGFAPGNCQVSFPGLDAAAWEAQ